MFLFFLGGVLWIWRFGSTIGSATSCFLQQPRFKGAGSRNRKQTFCAGQPACMRDFVYKSLCLTKWRTMKRRVGLPFLSPEFEWDQISCQVWVVFEFSISFQQFPLFVDLCLHINASLSFQPNGPVRGSLLLACCIGNRLLFVDWSIKDSQNLCF